VSRWQEINGGMGVHRHHQRRTDHATRQAIVAGYTSGRSMAAHAREHGLAVPTVRKTLEDAGVELRPCALRGKPFGSVS
jgi:transposase-like protein